MAVTQPPSFLSRLTSWMATHEPATAITLAGIIIYSVMRASYSTFYGRFNVEPEVVGLGQSEMIAHAALGLIVLILWTGGVMGFAYLGLRVLGLRPYRAPSIAPVWRRAMAFTSTPYWIIVIPTILSAALFVLFSLPVQARSLSTCRRRQLRRESLAVVFTGGIMEGAELVGLIHKNAGNHHVIRASWEL